jgi:serine/threonine protein kinase
MTGEKILNYKIENFTEENGLFRSFLATHTQFAKKVIVKTLKPLASQLEKADFLDDLRKLASIQHPNVLTLYDHLETAQDFYLVFEYVKGKTLADYIRYESGPIPESKTRTFFIQILQAFEFAHQKGVNNGAINTNNILISEEGEVKILDLALSKFFKQKMLQADDPETLRYASPEEIEGKETSQQTDIYALGLILFEMLTGKNPYEGFSNPEIRQKITHSVLPRITKYYPMVSAGMQLVVDKATAKNPSERFHSLKDFLAAIQKTEITSQTPIYAEPNNSEEEEIQAKKVEEDLSEVSSINLPLIFLIILLGASIGLWAIYTFRPQPESVILYNIKDMDIINAIQDSIAKAQAEQAITDSIRVFGGINKKDSSEIYIHKVERGENLQKIAKMYYQPLDSLKSLNNLTGRERLKPREGIKVRVKTIYKIQKGEDLLQVARKFKISANILKEVNQLYPKSLEPGEQPLPVIYDGKNIVIPLMTSTSK